MSAGCDRCYAENLSQRYGGPKWGPQAKRMVRAMPKSSPLQWEAQAKKTAKPTRVFCASMCDILDPHADCNELRPPLWQLIDQTKNLRWLLLTKRSELARGLLPEKWLRNWPSHVWLGATVESQDVIKSRLGPLMDFCCQRFVSCEPLIGDVVLEGFLSLNTKDFKPLDWIIVGGETAAGARPMDEAWVRSIRDEALDYKVPFFFKQWGPTKKHGRVLDGRTWDETPWD